MNTLFSKSSNRENQGSEASTLLWLGLTYYFYSTLPLYNYVSIIQLRELDAPVCGVKMANFLTLINLHPQYYVRFTRFTTKGWPSKSLVVRTIQELYLFSNPFHNTDEEEEDHPCEL